MFGLISHLLRVLGGERSTRHHVVNMRLLLISLTSVAVAVSLGFLWYRHCRFQMMTVLAARAVQLEGSGKWTEAIDYYQRSLALNPDDVDILLRLVQANTRLEPTPARRARLNRLLYQALGRVPQRDDLRRQLAESLFASGDFRAAETQANLIKKASKEYLGAQKVIALSFAARAVAGNESDVSEAISKVIDASDKLPYDVELASQAATLLRNHTGSMTGMKELKGRREADVADQIMDRLVASDRKNATAYLARYRYRNRYSLSNFDDDLRTASQLAPDNLDVLLLAAESAMPDPHQFAQAERWLRRAIELYPGDSRAYLALAQLLMKRENYQAATEVLQRGHSVAKEGLPLSLMLVDCEIASRDLTSSARTLQESELELAELRPNVNADTRQQLELQLANLHAKLDLANEQPQAALKTLNTARLLATAGAGIQKTPQWLESSVMLATIHSKLGLWNLATEDWKQVVDLQPNNTTILQAAAAAQVAAGQPAKAIELLDRSATLSVSSDELKGLKLRLVQSHLALQLSRPAAERNWTEFLKTLQSARAQAPEQWELVFAEFDYLVALEESTARVPAEAVSTAGSAIAQTPQELTLLRSAEKQYANQVNFLRSLAFAYQRLNSVDDVARVVAQFEQQEKDTGAVILLRANLLTKQGKFREADNLLAAAASSLPMQKRRQINRMRVQLLVASNEPAEAQQLVTKLLEAEPNNLELLKLAAETALSFGNYSSAEKWEHALLQIDPDGFDGRFLRARRLVATFPGLTTTAKEDLNTLIRDLQLERPRWYPLIAVAGQMALQQGDTRAAIDNLQLSINLGDSRPDTLQQLVTLLYQTNRIVEAKELLNRLSFQQPNHPVLDALRIDEALGQNRSAEALAIAKRGVEQHPDDPMRQVWLANLLLRVTQAGEAVKLLRQAAIRFPNDLRVLDALISTLAVIGQHEEAHRVIDSLNLDAKSTDAGRRLVAAEGFEALGDAVAARRQYELVLASQPDATPIRLRLARLLLAQDLVAAKAEYERTLQRDSSNIEARRALAAILAATGHEVDWTQAIKLLEGNQGALSADNASNDRLRAMLIAKRGRTREERIANCQEARKVIEQLIRSHPDIEVAINRRLLVGMLEQEANISGDTSLLYAAREQFRSIMKLSRRKQADILDYLEFLLRHATTKTTGNSLIAPSDDEALKGKQLKADFLGEAESYLSDLKQTSADGGESSDTLTSIALSVRLLAARGQVDEAAQILGQYLEKESKKPAKVARSAELYLIGGGLYSTLGKPAEAERWYRLLAAISPKAHVLVIRSLLAQNRQAEALEMCLKLGVSQATPECAIELANIMMTIPDTDAKLTEARNVLKAALVKYPNNLDLLQAAAVLSATRRQYDDAITALQRVVKLAPNNIMAINNLATLLAERPNQLAESLQLIERAIEAGGRQPLLLDTQGTIYLKAGDATKAVQCLEESIAGGATDPRYYFHLAAAYRGAKRVEAARRLLKNAVDFGLDTSVLTDDDRQLLTRLRLELGNEKTH